MSHLHEWICFQPHQQGLHHPISAYDQDVGGEIDRDRVFIVEKRARPTGIISLHDEAHLDPVEEKSLCCRRDREQDGNICQLAHSHTIMSLGSTSEDGKERGGAEHGLDTKEEVAEEGSLEPCFFLDDGRVWLMRGIRGRRHEMGCCHLSLNAMILWMLTLIGNGEIRPQCPERLGQHSTRSN